MPQQATRREFMQQSTALGVAWWVGSHWAPAFADSKSAVERLNFACIGVQGKGSSDTDAAGANGNVIALCDIDDRRLNKKALEFPDARKYNDYRVMLDELRSEIDAVTVSTPDHTHAPASAMAMRMGKHCFCQKPLTWSVYEARRLRQLAEEFGVQTQMGNQGTADSGFRESVEVVQSGVIGDVREVHVWTNRPKWPQGTGRPEIKSSAPAHVHWNLFLGPAPERLYNAGYHPFAWRGWLDFGTGALGDMACHTANMAVMALDLFDPQSVVAESAGIVENETFPKWSVIEFEFGPRGERPATKLIWYDGGRTPPRDLLEGEEMADSGLLLVGDEGKFYSANDYGAAYVLLPKEKFADYKPPEPTLPRIGGKDAHFPEFAAACRGGSPGMSNFDYAARLTETILLGNLALRAGRRIEWDAQNMLVTNVPEVNQYLHREYREGWTL